MMSQNTPFLTFIGKSNSGKTTLLVKLIPELKNKGYRVATIKHSHHNVVIDKEGKDSWKHRAAGSETVVLISGKQVSCVRDFQEEPTLEFVRDNYIHDVDIILAEGFKGSKMPKIWVFRGDSSSVINKDDNLIAVASDRKVSINTPWFDINDVKKLADFIEKTFLNASGGGPI